MEEETHLDQLLRAQSIRLDPWLISARYSHVVPVCCSPSGRPPLFPALCLFAEERVGGGVRDGGDSFVGSEGEYGASRSQKMN